MTKKDFEEIAKKPRKNLEEGRKNVSDSVKLVGKSVTYNCSIKFLIHQEAILYLLPK